jgi:hypothetical protein
MKSLQIVSKYRSKNVNFVVKNHNFLVDQKRKIGYNIHMLSKKETDMSLLRGGKTGAEPGLLQDDSRALFRWFASRIDARWTLRRVLTEY